MLCQWTDRQLTQRGAGEAKIVQVISARLFNNKIFASAELSFGILAIYCSVFSDFYQQV